MSQLGGEQFRFEPLQTFAHIVIGVFQDAREVWCRRAFGRFILPHARQQIGGGPGQSIG